MSYQEYPRVLYGPLGLEDTKIVNTEEEKAAALEGGYALLPSGASPADHPAEPPAPAEAKAKKKPEGKGAK